MNAKASWKFWMSNNLCDKGMCVRGVSGGRGGRGGRGGGHERVFSLLCTIMRGW